MGPALLVRATRQRQREGSSRLFQAALFHFRSVKKKKRTMNSLIQFKGTASFSRSVDCENAERFIFKALCGPVFAVSARSRRGRPRRPIADRLDNLLDCVNHQL